ncbi:MAG: metallophosphoesterase [Deltaproteobacteria bacterium]|jgi:predicted MPP superfamily phosphohydrolase|nr:metallophosphoesterase [Deltaproteobacteria bacterium]
MFLLLFGPLMAAMGAFVCWRLVCPLPLATHWQIVWYALIMAGAMKMALFRLIRGTFSINSLPDWLLLASGWWNVAVTALFFLLLAFWAAQGVALRFGACLPMHPKSALVFMCAAMLISACGLWQGTASPQLRHIDLSLANLPPELEGLRIVHITDMHIGPLFHAPRTEELVARINALKPDLVCITGDIVDGSVRELRADTAPLAKLRAGYGVWACAGNHEYYSGFAQWRESLAALGIRMLVNEHAVLWIRSRPLVLAGVSDEAAARFGLEEPDIGKALAGIPADAPRIVLAHRPAGSAAHARHGVWVQFSGHTHGGQALPIQPLVKALNDSYLYGLYTLDNMILYVGAGAGLWSGYPARFAMPPEFVLFRLTKKVPAADQP